MPAKLTIEHAHDLANSRGFQFLSTEFKNTKTKHLWGCEKGHEWNAVFRSIYQGSGCPHCAVKNIKDAHNLAIFRGFKFLSLEFKNTNTKHLWGCGQGHQWLAKYNDIQQGKGCLHCSGKFPKTIQDAHDLAKSRGYKFLSPEFKNVKTKYLWECKLGHQWSAVYNNIKQGTGCPNCAGSIPKTIQDAHDLAKIKGYKFLSTEFKCTKTKHLWGCGQGHQWSADFNKIQGGRGCPHCSGKFPKTIQDAHDLAKIKGYKFLSTEFKCTKTKHLWGCSQGHEWSATFNDIQRGNGCPDCAGLKPKTIKDAHDLAKSRGYKFLSPEFKNVKTKYLWECKLGHQWSAVYDNIKRSTGCPLCSDNLRGEKLTRYCFVKMFRCYFDKIKPDWIRNPKTGRKLELDGYNELLKIAFEHQGQSHELDCPKESMLYNSEQIFRDEIKRQKCKEHGITLIEVPEIGRRLKVKDVVPFLLSEFDKHNIAYPESAKSFQIDMKEFYAEYIN